MNAYRLGLIGPLLDYAVKKYSGHRRIPAGVTAADIMISVRRGDKGEIIIFKQYTAFIFAICGTLNLRLLREVVENKRKVL
jgi:hypothetical protein